MSNRWPGGVIRKTPVTPAGPLQNGAASGVWTLADAAYWTKQGLWPLAGNTLAVEDVFSTYLYTGNGSTQTITNGIDLAGKGGLVWLKQRNAAAYTHNLVDTARGFDKYLYSSATDAQETVTTRLQSFNSTGFSLGSNLSVNGSGNTMASWTFRKAPKFFDVVTYTGDGNSSTDTPSPFGRGIPHSLGVRPGFVVIKRTDAAGDWWVAAQKSGGTQWVGGSSTPFSLNSTNAAESTRDIATRVYATETAFYPAMIAGNGGSALSINGATYVAYLFAHDPTADGIIQCGSYTTAGNGTASVTLGWEPQALLLKRADSSTNGDWILVDNMRGFGAINALGQYVLFPNLSSEEGGMQGTLTANATGFNFSYGGNVAATYIYVAIRRGPMKTPTLGTSVFSPVFASGTAPTYTTGFPVDWSIFRAPSSPSNNLVGTRLLQGTGLVTESTTAAFSDTANMFDYNTGWHTGSNTGYISWNFRRAPGFFDVVAYTGNGTPGGGGTRAISHNLGVAPEFVIVKSRSGSFGWTCYYPASNIGLVLNGTNASFSPDFTSVSATTFTVIDFNSTNASGSTYVAYLFASCPGVSKVGSYTGNGSSQTINCAFTTGARYVLIKRTDSTGDWYVWDSARGIVAGNDPYLALNSTAAEVTSNDSVDTDNTGFIVNQVAASNVNVNGATYIYFAVS